MLDFVRNSQRHGASATGRNPRENAFLSRESARNLLGIGEGHVTLTDEAGLVVAVAVLMKTP